MSFVCLDSREILKGGGEIVASNLFNRFLIFSFILLIFWTLCDTFYLDLSRFCTSDLKYEDVERVNGS
jgi:hypothetical protein